MFCDLSPPIAQSLQPGHSPTQAADCAKASRRREAGGGQGAHGVKAHRRRLNCNRAISLPALDRRATRGRNSPEGPDKIIRRNNRARKRQTLHGDRQRCRPKRIRFFSRAERGKNLLMGLRALGPRTSLGNGSHAFAAAKQQPLRPNG